LHSAGTTAFTRRRAALLIGGYALGLGGMIYLKGLYLSEDRYFLILLVPAALLGLTRRYILDFLPFIALMLGYEELRGVAHIIRPDPYYAPQIDIDKFLFNGTIPTVWLQEKLWSGHVEWWQKVLDVLLHLHFIVPPTIRLLFSTSYRAVVPLSLVVGAGFLVLTDVIARTVLSPQELPIGVITAFLGAPFFAIVLKASRTIR